MVGHGTPGAAEVGEEVLGCGLWLLLAGAGRAEETLADDENTDGEEELCRPEVPPGAELSGCPARGEGSPPPEGYPGVLVVARPLGTPPAGVTCVLEVASPCTVVIGARSVGNPPAGRKAIVTAITTTASRVKAANARETNPRLTGVVS